MCNIKNPNVSQPTPKCKITIMINIPRCTKCPVYNYKKLPQHQENMCPTIVFKKCCITLLVVITTTLEIISDLCKIYYRMNQLGPIFETISQSRFTSLSTKIKQPQNR